VIFSHDLLKFSNDFSNLTNTYMGLLYTWIKSNTVTRSFTLEEATSIQSLFIIPKQILLNESIGCSGSTFTFNFRDLMALKV